MSKIIKNTFNVVKSIVGGVATVARGITTSLFPGPPDQPGPAAQAPAPTPMPTPDDKAIQEAKKKSIASVLNRTGRASTILTATDAKDTLGV